MPEGSILTVINLFYSKETAKEEKRRPENETSGLDNESCHATAEAPTPHQDQDTLLLSRTTNLDVSGAGDHGGLPSGLGPGHVFGGKEGVAVVDYVPMSYASAAAQPSNLNKLDTEGSSSGKFTPVDAGKTTAVPVLTMRVSPGQDDRDGSTLSVTFKVLLSSELMLPNTRLGIVFGEPLSDWQEVRVEMSEENPAVKIEDGRYQLMVGDLCFPQQLVGKTIPYKYVAFEPGRVVKFEGIHAYGTGIAKANRCLIVPNGQVGFTQYDDVILCDDWDDRFDRQNAGRFFATIWMLPRPAELANPQFDFVAALDKFEAVVRAHGPGGARVCIGDRSKYRYTSDLFYKGKSVISTYFGKWIKIIENAVNTNSRDGGKLLRSALYVCLIAASKCCSYQLSPDDRLLIFEAFFACTDELQQESVLQSVEVRQQVCDGLKQLVKKFVSLSAYAVDSQKRGNWIAVIPFIHRWDPVDVRDSNWLDLTEWKRENRLR